MPSTIEPAAPAEPTRSGVDLDDLNEAREVERVVKRLQDRYPTLTTEEIRTAVSVAVHAFDGAKVRHFIPLLVERTAKQSLDHLRDSRSG